MIAVDTNILVYAHRRDSPWFDVASRKVAMLAEGKSAWAIPWPCLHEFFAIATHPKIYAPPSPVEVALDQIDAWLDSPTLTVLSESGTHWQTLRSLVAAAKVAGPVVHDARIAALCLDHGVAELWTADRDFGRFRGLVTVNPLVDPGSRSS